MDYVLSSGPITVTKGVGTIIGETGESPPLKVEEGGTTLRMGVPPKQCQVLFLGDGWMEEREQLPNHPLY